MRVKTRSGREPAYPNRARPKGESLPWRSVAAISLPAGERGDRGEGGARSARDLASHNVAPRKAERSVGWSKANARRRRAPPCPLAPYGRKREPADKPGSVVGSHSSGMYVTVHLTRPTREPCGPHYAPLFGLAPGGVCPATGVTTGAVRSYRTISPLPRRHRRGGIFSVALSVGSRPPGVTWHPALWSPDFPPCRTT